MGTVLDRWRSLRERRLERRMAATKLLRAFADQYPRAFVIEIGANDGVEHDPIRPFLIEGHWRAILVEPAPEAFARLQRNYAGAGDRIELVKVAIANHDGHVPFFSLDRVEGAARERLDVFGSLSAEAIRTSAAIFVPEEHRQISRNQVPCLRFESLCERHGVVDIDLLTIDVEGFDFEVVKQLDFELRRPRLLSYEHLLLSPADREGCRQLLERHGYETLAERRDTWCLDTRPDDALTRSWRRLRPAVPADSIYSG